MLPEYDVAYAEVLAYNRRQHDDREQRAAVLERLRTILGGHVREGRHEHTLHAYLGTGPEGSDAGSFRSAAVRARGDGTRVDVTLADVPAELAEQVALLVTRAATAPRNPLAPEMQQVLDLLDLSTPLSTVDAASRTGQSDTDAAVILEALHMTDFAATDGDGYRLTLTGRARQTAPARPAV